MKRDKSLGHPGFSAPPPKGPYLVVVRSWLLPVSRLDQPGLKWQGGRRSDRLTWEGPFDSVGYLSTSAPKGR